MEILLCHSNNHDQKTIDDARDFIATHFTCDPDFIRREAVFKQWWREYTKEWYEPDCEPPQFEIVNDKRNDKKDKKEILKRYNF